MSNDDSKGKKTNHNETMLSRPVIRVAAIVRHLADHQLTNEEPVDNLFPDARPIRLLLETEFEPAIFAVRRAIDSSRADLHGKSMDMRAYTLFPDETECELPQHATHIDSLFTIPLQPRSCLHGLKRLVLKGHTAVDDPLVFRIGDSCPNLVYFNVSGCSKVSDASLISLFERFSSRNVSDDLFHIDVSNTAASKATVQHAIRHLDPETVEFLHFGLRGFADDELAAELLSVFEKLPLRVECGERSYIKCRSGLVVGIDRDRTNCHVVVPGSASADQIVQALRNVQSCYQSR